MKTDGNIFAGLPDAFPSEMFETLATSANIRIERILSCGHSTPEGEWYDQGWDEWVLLLAGKAGLLIDGEHEPRSLETGDYIMIPAHCRHRVVWTSTDERTVWLAVHIGG